MMIKTKIINMFAKLFKTIMITGYKNPDGRKTNRTRISNTTHLGHKQHLTLGDNVYIGHYNVIDASNQVKIGEGCQITNFVNILSHSSHVSIRLYGNDYTNHTNPKGYIKGAVDIGAYTFVGPHSIIMPDTKIGRGSIVSAYSYVKGEFPDFSIIKGNPAKVVGDTREKDKEYLEQFPELKKSYNEWATK